MSFQTINPATGEVIQTYEHNSWSQVELAIEEIHLNFQKWRGTTFSERKKVLMKLAENFKQQRSTLARSMTLEMGKLESESLAEIDKCVLACEYYSEKGEDFLKPQEVKTAYQRAFVSFQPLGVVFSIMPWNFPLWQTVRFAVPSLMAGNVILLKHSDLTAGTAELIASCFENLHDDLKLLVNMRVSHEVCARAIAHPLIRGVTFTGSTRGGKQVAVSAAQAMKKSVFELGGSDAYVVLADADIEKAAKICATARLVNCGQSCVAAKRFIVVQDVAALFTEALIREMKQLKIASLANKKFQQQVVLQVEKLVLAGGKILLGGIAPAGPGAFYPATVLFFDESPKVLQSEEIFGPVASVIVAHDEKTAIQIANSTIYGLGGALFTKNIAKGLKIIEEEFEAGFVVLNDQVKSDPRLPFGGVKESGYGRELGSFGIHEFVNTKTVAVGG